MNVKKNFAKKLMNEDFKLACIVKFLNFLLEFYKPLHKLLNDTKFTKSMKTMGILHDKSNMRLTTLLTKSNMSLTIIDNIGIIILDPNTIKSNATAS